MSLMDLLDKFKNVRILVIGDLMIDKYLIGDVNRISPEAPVPVVKLKFTKLIAGGAANVAANIVGLNGMPYLLGVIGDDAEGELLLGILEKSGISSKHVVKIKDRQTTVKNRVLAHNQQIARIDQEENGPISQKDEGKIWLVIKKIMGAVDAVVISDYQKGLLSKNLIARLIKFSKENNKVVLVDPKGKDYSKYSGANLLTPNKFEVEEVSRANGISDEMLETAGKRLKKNLKLDALLITRGEEGMTLFETRKKTLHLKALARHVYDVTGAGDTVIATLAMAIGAGASYPVASAIANTAAGLVVEEVGTCIIKINNLKKNLK